MNLENKFLEIIMFGMVAVRYDRLPTKLLFVEEPIFLAPSCFLNTNGKGRKGEANKVFSLESLPILCKHRLYKSREKFSQCF